MLGRVPGMARRRVESLRESPERVLPFVLLAAGPPAAWTSWYAAGACGAGVGPWWLLRCLGDGEAQWLLGTGLALSAAVGLVGGLLAFLALCPVVERTTDTWLGGLVFAPDHATAATVVGIWLLTASLYGPLMMGHLADGPVTWFALAVPYYPLLGDAAVVAAAATAETATTGAVRWVVRIVTLAVFGLSLLVELVWLYLLGAGVAEVGRHTTDVFGR